MTRIDHIPPQNLEAEQSVLGSILMLHDAYADVVTPEIGLTQADFYIEQHQRIFAAMGAIANRGERIDIITVQAELDRRKSLQRIGGVEYLANLLDCTPTAAHAAYYAGVVREKSFRRRVIEHCELMKALAYDGETASDDLRGRLQAGALTLGEEGSAADEWISYSELISGRVLPKIEHAYETGEAITGIPSGIPKLDNLTCGWNAPDLIIVAGRTSYGKTALAMQLGEYAAREGHAVGVFSVEMAAEQLGLRAVQASADLSGYSLRNPRTLADTGWSRLVDGAATAAMLPIYINDYGGLRYDQIGAAAMRAKQKWGIELFVLDFTQLIIGPKGESRNREVGQCVQTMKMTAKALGVPFIALSQLSRRADQERRAPVLSDLRDSGEIEHYSDVVIFLHMDQDKGRGELIVAKNRQLSCGKVPVRWIGRTMRFVQEAEEADE